MKNTFITTGLLALSFIATNAQNNIPVYLDDKQPIELRIEDALKRMTLEEKTRLSYAQGERRPSWCTCRNKLE